MSVIDISTNKMVEQGRMIFMYIELTEELKKERERARELLMYMLGETIPRLGFGERIPLAQRSMRSKGKEAVPNLADIKLSEITLSPTVILPE